MSIFSSLRYCTQDHPSNYTNLYWALGFIPLGLFFDFMDGKVARWRKKASLMGQELDSLADLISFGMGPAAAAFALAAILAPAVRAQDGGFTAQTVIDRAEIEDLLQRYYANFGKAEGEAFSSFYADDAQFVLAGKTYRGKDEIAGAYKAIGASGQNPAAGRFSFNVLLTNPVITVHGNAATDQMIFTEIVMDTATAPPRGWRRRGPKSGARSGFVPISSRRPSYCPRLTCARRFRSGRSAASP